jgi:hypothetical protein
MVVETIELLIRGVSIRRLKKRKFTRGDEHNQKYLDKYVG